MIQKKKKNKNPQTNKQKPYSCVFINFTTLLDVFFLLLLFVFMLTEPVKWPSSLPLC